MSSEFRVDARTLEVLEWSGIRHALATRTRTAVGERLASALVPGSLGFAEARGQAQAVLELATLKADTQLSPPLGDIPEISPILLRMSRSGAIGVAEFANVVRALKAVHGLQNFLLRYAGGRPELQKILRAFDACEEWGRKHFPLLDAQGELVDAASDDLRALRKLAHDLHARIKTRLEEYLNSPRLAELMQDFYVTIRDGRYVIPVKTNFRGRVPGIIHDVSNTEATLFIEPQEVVDWNNQLKVTEKEIEREIEKILQEVSLQTRSAIPAMRRNEELVGVADVLAAAADLTGAWGADVSVAEVGDEINFAQLRHPVLALRQSVVANDIGWREALVLTGPNTGGKTVLLKSVGLAVSLARAGLPIPARRAVLPANLGGLIADIGDDQNLENKLSTFSGHLTVLREMLERSAAGDLILIDEIATGTSPEEGQPLAQAVIESLLDRQVRVFVTTHYGTLKQFAMTDDRSRIAAMSFDMATRRPTFEILMDVPGNSSAFETAEQLGLAPEILRRARELRGDVSEDVGRAITRLEEARQKFVARENQLETAIAAAREREARAEQRTQALELRQRESLSTEARELLRQLAAVRDELAQAVKRASTEELQAGATALFQKIAQGADEIRSVASDVSRPEALTLAPGDLAPEAIVEVENLGLGTIVELPKNAATDPKALALVQVGDIRTRVPVGRLKKPAADRRQQFLATRSSVQAARERKMGAALRSASASGSFVCDVRGKSVDDAMRRMEASLNELARDENAIITVIHGHGSERLKDGLRDYLARRGDLQFRSGTWPGEGGDGVTVVERAKT